MPTKGPVTEVERDYVRSKFPQLSVADIAKNMGRSRACVNNIVNSEGLRERCKRPPSIEYDGDGMPDDPLSSLKELLGVLESSLAAASPRDVAALAREYRATVESIERMEGGSNDEAVSALDTVAKSIALRMSS